jgi:hypothetical protein
VDGSTLVISNSPRNHSEDVFARSCEALVI